MIPTKGIRFIHDIDPGLVDYMCNNYDYVEVTFAAYNYEEIFIPNGDGSTHTRKLERTQKAGFSSQIQSSKDVVQFDTSDMKVLTPKTKKELR
jgi:beta-lactamase superfamily II metal-dependent hydrolase